MKRISILGSTGSIGRQSLEVIGNHHERFKIAGLACNSNIWELKKQIEKHNPEAVAVMDREKADELSSSVDVCVYSGIEGISKIACLESADMVVNSLVGSIGILPTLKTLEAGKQLALANKEALVSAGSCIMKKANQKNSTIIPVDSEHSGIFQCLHGEHADDVKKITLTCSGGPFHEFDEPQLRNVTKEQALKHPVWSMGSKISIDSATLMNKGFEVIEAHWLYGIDYGNIDVVVHPQSIVHSFVEFLDGSILAQMAYPDMRIPIQYALGYPERLNHSPVCLDLSSANLVFKKPRRELFPCLDLAYHAGKTSGTMPAVMNAADEVAVKSFLEGKIGFQGIYGIIKQAMDAHKPISNPTVEEILEVDKKTREQLS